MLKQTVARYSPLMIQQWFAEAVLLAIPSMPQILMVIHFHTSFVMPYREET